MNRTLNFRRATMPESRRADYYLGCLDSSVFFDFNSSPKKEISLIRISFDGFGCCNFKDKAKKFNHIDSQKLIKEIKRKELNQELIAELVKKAIEINKEFIWTDALERYGLIDTN